MNLSTATTSPATNANTTTSTTTTTTNGPPPPATPFPLLRLPRELRLEVLSYLISFGVVLPSRRTPHKPFVVWWFDADGRRMLQHSAILYTSRLLYREALPVLRKVRLLIDDCRVITPLAKSLDERTRTVLRSVTLNRAAVRQRGVWEEVCRELGGLGLRDLEVSIEGTDEMLRTDATAAAGDGRGMQGEGGAVVLPPVALPSASQQQQQQSTEADVVSAAMGRGSAAGNFEWVEDMLGIKGLQKLSVRIPEATRLEKEVRQYLKSRMVGVQVSV